jgi:hypothetical protein
MLGSSLIAAQLVASQEGLSSMKFVSFPLHVKEVCLAGLEVKLTLPH